VGVSAVVGDGGGPAGHFADVVAAGAQPAAVGQGAGSAIDPAMDVVEVADRRVAVGVAAGAVSQPDQGAQGAVEASPEPIPTDDRPAGRAGEQPPPPPPAAAGAEKIVGGAGGDRAVSGDLGRGGIVGVEQRWSVA
jgi:hypothetical protein